MLPTIAKVLAKIEYIEEVGEGWDKVIKEHEEHPLNPKMPKIESSKHSVTVTLFSTKEKFKKEKTVGKITTQKTTQKILLLIKENSQITRNELSKILDITPDGVKYHLNNLKKKGILKRIGGRKEGHWKVIE